MEKALMLLSLNQVELSLLFVNDVQMQKLNKMHRGIDKTTDVLSFPMYDSPSEFPKEGVILLGDIVINADKARRDADEKQLTLYDEICTLLIHGLLHLLGYDHEKNSYQAQKMLKKENELASALKAVD
ncbi:MAG: rRNA maturation RNase YbeY [Candidatus Magnetoovum sp. WYHC-5]|nr:rRNA maturation RNase YbeY [Candidatus Magnetoovum sp. WYHC-5]